jgi:hypothetical protein
MLTCMRSRLLTCTYAFLHANTHASRLTCMRTCTQASMHAHKHAYRFTCMPTCLHACLHACSHVCGCMLAHAWHAHAHACVRMLTCMCMLRRILHASYMRAHADLHVCAVHAYAHMFTCRVACMSKSLPPAQVHACVLTRMFTCCPNAYLHA